MGGYVPETLKAIEEYNPDLVELIERLDKVLLETLEICIITGGVPTFSVAKKGIGRLFKEMEKSP